VEGGKSTKDNRVIGSRVRRRRTRVVHRTAFHNPRRERGIFVGPSLTRRVVISGPSLTRRVVIGLNGIAIKDWGGHL